MQPEQNALSDLVNKIVGIAHPMKIFLFGSAATGEMQAGSDLDIMIIMPEGTHRRRTAQQLYQALEGIKTPYEIIVATPGDLEQFKDSMGLIYYKILAEGQLLYAA